MAVSISKEQAQKLASLKRQEGRAFLIHILGWPEFDEDDDPQHSIHVDFLYDNVMFMINKGFAWNAVGLLFEVAKRIIQESMGKTLPEIIKVFNRLINDVQGKVNNESLKKYTDYFFSTFMSHFKLYQYVFTINRERLQIKLSQSVDILSDPMPFTEAKDVDVYEYEQKYKDIETQEQHTQEERFKIQEKTKLEDFEKLQNTLETVDNVDPPLDRQKIVDIIHEVAGAHITSASHSIQQSIQGTMEDLGFMFEKTALERPQALGTPPRYKPKTPLTATAAGGKRTAAVSREKSPTKSQSRLSTKGSKR